MAGVPYFGSVLEPGQIDKKYVVFIGLQDYSGTTIRISYLPKGTFLLSASDHNIKGGVIKSTGHGFDVVKEFDFPVYDDFPKTLYGIQNDVRYDPNYNLTNPSGDGQYYVSDAKQFMQAVTDSKFFAPDFRSLFGDSAPGSPINVYVGTIGSPGVTPVDPSAYTWNPVAGTVNFTTPLTPDKIVSIDGVPLGMAPEDMLKHLFVDKAGWDTNALTLQKTNIILPRYTGQNSSLWVTAQAITQMTAPRFVAFTLRLNEFGNIFFYENRLMATPVAVLTDEFDLLSIQQTISSDQIVNVVRGDARANNDQPVTSISIDTNSVAVNGQRNPYTIPDLLLYPTRGMVPSTALCFMNMITASTLHELSSPIDELRCDITPNPAYQVGDKVLIQELRTGIIGNYTIKELTDTIAAGKYTSSARFRRTKLFANVNMGFPSAVVRTTGTSDAAIAQDSVIISGATGIISEISIGGVNCLHKGAPVLDSFGNSLIPSVTGASWPFSLTLATANVNDTYIWRWLSFECNNTLDANDAMVARLPSWVAGDTTLIPKATVQAGFTVSDTWTSGANIGSSTAYKYSNIYAGPQAFGPVGYAGVFSVVANFASDTSGGTNSFGVAFGPSYTGSYSWLPNLKQNYGYWHVMAVNKNGAIAYIRQPFTLDL